MEQDHATSHVRSVTVQPRSSNKPLVLIALVLAVAIGSFVGGMQYQKGKADTSLTANGSGTSQFGGMGSGQGQAMNGSLGTVTAISAASISVKDQRSATTKTYAIDSSTTISDDGSSASYSDIKTGDTVMVQASSSSSTTAAQITINPTMGGGPGGQTSASSGTTAQ